MGEKYKIMDYKGFVITLEEDSGEEKFIGDNNDCTIKSKSLKDLKWAIDKSKRDKFERLSFIDPQYSNDYKKGEITSFDSETGVYWVMVNGSKKEENIAYRIPINDTKKNWQIIDKIKKMEAQKDKIDDDISELRKTMEKIDLSKGEE